MVVEAARLGVVVEVARLGVAVKVTKLGVVGVVWFADPDSDIVETNTKSCG